MAEQWQIRRGTTAENDDFTGAMGELSLDTDNGVIRVHNGETQGGGAFIDTIVGSQLPTADNNYTWCRRYASGWVEQGGQTNYSTGGQTINLPIEMADTNYYVAVTIYSNQGFSASGGNTPAHSCVAVSTTQIRVSQENASSKKSYWEVKGMAASA